MEPKKHPPKTATQNKESFVRRALRVHMRRTVTGRIAPLLMVCLLVAVAIVLGTTLSRYRTEVPRDHSFSTRVENDYYGALQSAFLEGDNGEAADTAIVLGDSVFSRNVILIDVTDGNRVICVKNPDEQAYPASLTKIMTVLVSLEHMSNLYVTYTLEQDIFDYVKEQNASVAGFLSGEEVPLIDLLYGTLLPSGSEAAIALARYVAGSEGEFVALMNQKAAALGMTSTHFTNVTGLHDPAQVTTARDMATLLQHAIQNSRFLRILTTRRYSTQASNLHPYGFTMYSTVYSGFESNDMEMPYIKGGKTGFTPEAGQCLATYSVRDEHEYVLVTLGAGTGTNRVAYHMFDADAIIASYAGVAPSPDTTGDTTGDLSSDTGTESEPVE